MMRSLFNKALDQPDVEGSEYWNQYEHKNDCFYSVLYFGGLNDSDCKGQPTPSVIYSNQVCLSKTTELTYSEGNYGKLVYRKISEGKNAFAIFCPNKNMLDTAFSKFYEDIGVSKDNLKFVGEKEKNRLEAGVFHRITIQKALSPVLIFKDNEPHYVEFFGIGNEIFKFEFNYRKTITGDLTKKQEKDNTDRIILNIETHQSSTVARIRNFREIKLKGRCYLETKVRDNTKESYLWGLIDIEKPLQEMLYGLAKSIPFKTEILKESTAKSRTTQDGNTYTDLPSCFSLIRQR